MDYPPRVYHFSLHTVGLVVGLGLLAIHLVALLHPAQTQAWLRRFPPSRTSPLVHALLVTANTHALMVQAWLRRFPRSRTWGRILMAGAAVWSFWLATNLDLGEFSGFRRPIQMIIPVLAILTMLYVEEFLAVRALGILALLAAEPVLSAAFLHPQWTRLFLVVLAYAWIIAGMFWVGKPYLLRDQISWISKTPQRWRIATAAGVIYGIVVLTCTFTQF